MKRIACGGLILVCSIGCDGSKRDGPARLSAAVTPSPIAVPAGESKAARSDSPRPVRPSDEMGGRVARVAPRPISPIDQLPEGQLYRTAIAALDLGRVADAEKARERLKAQTQRPVLVRAVEGFKLAKQGRFDEAIAIAEEVSRVPVMQGEAYLIAGEAFHKRGLWADAIGAFQGASQSDPANPRPHRWLGMIHYDLGAMTQAIDHLRTVADLDPTDSASLRLSGLIHHDYERFEEAIADYRRVLERGVSPGMELKVRLELADSLRQLRRYPESLAAIDTCPDGADVLAMRAACLESAGQVEDAMRSADAALRFDPLHPLANLVSGRLHLAQQSWGKSIAALRTAVEAEPTQHGSRYLLGRALLLSGDHDAAAAELAKSEELRELALKLSELHLEAVSKPDDASVRLQMGVLAERLGRPQTALNWYHAALALDGESATAAEAVRRLSRPPSLSPTP